MMWKPLKNRQGPLHDIGIKQRKNTNYEQLNLISKLIINRIQASLQWFFLGQKLTNYYIRHSFERHFFEIFPLTASQLCPQCWSLHLKLFWDFSNFSRNFSVYKGSQVSGYKLYLDKMYVQLLITITVIILKEESWP